MHQQAAALLEPNRKEPQDGDTALSGRADGTPNLLLHAPKRATAARKFLTLDIETLGLLHHDPLPEMTCVCLYDGDQQHSLLFYGISAAEREANAQTLLKLLDEAPVLAGFNAVCFDLPFIGRSLRVKQQRVDAWVAKCVDPFLGMRSTAGRTCKLQRLLDLNALGSKTGSGSDAIGLALDGRKEELLEYCMNDVLLTHRLCMLDEVRLSETQSMRLLPACRRWQLCGGPPPVPHAQLLLQALKQAWLPYGGPGSSDGLVASGGGAFFARA